jgi:hypothetical protein
VLDWGTVQTRLRRQVSDLTEDSSGNEVDPDFTESDLLDFWVDAQNDLVLYIGRSRTLTVPAEKTSYPLPEDLYKVLWVRYNQTTDPYNLRELDLGAGHRDDVDDPPWEGLYWYITDDTIEFTDTPEYTVTVRYRAFYPEPSLADAGSPIYVPRWAIQALMYYCAAEALERKVIDDANLRRWASRQTDAGKPTDNPFLQVCKYLLERYQSVINKHLVSTQERSTWPSSFR